MVCDNCLGLIIISISCLSISYILFRKYYKDKNPFTGHITLFFFLNGLGFLIWFLSTELVFNIYEEIENILLIIGFLPQIVLLYFILTFYEISLPLRLIIIFAALFFSLMDLFVPILRIYIFEPSFRLYFIISAMIYFSNIILFLINWRKNEDIKSLFFSLGLFFNLLAMMISYFSQLLQGIFLIITALIWIVAYSGIIEKVI
jgi:hypothetical protein